MTKSTDTKNITKIVKAILQENGIDLDKNLMLEIQLVSAWKRYVFEREEGLSPAEVREKIANEYIFSESPGVMKAQKCIQEVQDAMGLDVNYNLPAWFTVIQFVMKKADEGQTIQQYRAWCDSDKFNSPKTHQIAQKPMLIKDTWRKAFEGVSNTEDKFKDGSAYV